LGGGTLIAPENQLMIRLEGPLICLKHQKQFPNVVVETEGRPLWDETKLELLYEQRKEGYSWAEVMITPGGRAAETVVNEMINVWENHGSRS
jgi:shikimate kinase